MKAMSHSTSHSPYFKWLESSASPQVKRELTEMEKSKRNSFASLKEVMNRSYGRQGNK